MQTFVPNEKHLAETQSTATLQVGLSHAVISASMHDRVAQRVDAQRIAITDNGIRLYPLAYRYAWPSELDLMATISGLELDQRHDGWRREPYSANGFCVSVYRRKMDSCASEASAA